MKYEVKKSKSKYVGFLQLSEGMQVFCTLGKRKVHDPDSEKGRPSVHYSATLDADCEHILKREGNSEKMIVGKVGDLIGIREIPPLRDLEEIAEGTHVRITLLGTSYRGEDKSSPRHDIEIAVESEG